MQSQASLSLLDMPASTPPLTSRGMEQPWSELLDWSMPSAEDGASLKQVQTRDAAMLQSVLSGVLSRTHARSDAVVGSPGQLTFLVGCRLAERWPAV